MEGVGLPRPATAGAAISRSAGIGDREREALYDDLKPLVRRLIARYGGDPELRQELAGEIYCRFCELLYVYDPDRGIPLKPYLVRALSTSVFSYARSGWRRVNREVSLQDDVQLPVARANPSDEWDDAIVMADLLRALPAALEQLPLRQRQVVIWRYYEARSFEEIGQALGIQPATVRSTLRHGVANLRRHFGPSAGRGGHAEARVLSACAAP